jgi:hypothetical protein
LAVNGLNFSGVMIEPNFINGYIRLVAVLEAHLRSDVFFFTEMFPKNDAAQIRMLEVFSCPLKDKR